MKRSIWPVAAALLTLTGCAAGPGAQGPSGGYVANLPEGVLAIVAPYQDLTAVKIDPADGCYVYRHVGPVETTFLPLRAKNGRPICTRAPGDPAPTS